MIFHGQDFYWIFVVILSDVISYIRIFNLLSSFDRLTELSRLFGRVCVLAREEWNSGIKKFALHLKFAGGGSLLRAPGVGRSKIFLISRTHLSWPAEKRAVKAKCLTKLLGLKYRAKKY
jgi:hypothetical protein